MEAAINSEVTANIGRAELFSMPVLLILLLVIFGSLAAASAAAGDRRHRHPRLVRRAAAAHPGHPVSVYSVNITTILGLGLAIDYGLFMVSRFREELRRQPTVEARGGAHGGHRGPDRRRLRHHRGGGAGQPDAVPGGRSCARWASAGWPRSLVDMLAALTVLPALLAVLGPG